MNSQQKKKKWGKKSEFMKRRGKKNGKKKVKTAVPLFNPKTILKFLLFAYAQSSQANILHLDQKAGKCMTCKQLCGKFYVALYSQTMT